MIKILMVLLCLAFFAPLVSAQTSGNPICEFCGVGGNMTNPDAIFPLPEPFATQYPQFKDGAQCSIMWLGAQAGLIEEESCVGLITDTDIQSICGCEEDSGKSSTSTLTNDSSSSKLLPTTMTTLGVLSVFAGLIL